MTPPHAPHPLHDVRLPGPTLVVVDDSDGLALDALRGIEDVPGIDPQVVTLSSLTGPRKGWGSVLVVAADRARLRRMASAVPLLGQCKAIACWLTDAPTPWVLVPRPEWPPLVHLAAREAGDRGVLTVVRFASGARAQLVVMEMARQAAGPGDTTHGGVVVSYAGRPAAPGLDARAVLLPDVAGAGAQDRDVPPDVVVAARRRGSAAGALEAHHVIDRPPTVVTDPGPEPVDERVFHPVGFRKDWDHPVVDLARLVAGSGSGPVTEDVVAAARAFQGVRLPAEPATSDLLALAMAGVPLVLGGTGSGEGASALPEVAAPLAQALVAEVDLDDALRREEHSLAVRRAAFDHHSTLAWRSALADRAGIRHVGLPPVSALLATRRPDMLDFALRQVGRQRGAEVELVLAAHGFEPDRDAVRRALGDRPHQVLEFDRTAFFGDVLTAAARAASSELVLKVDDDDWYSPDAVHDLVMARRFSGADVVGMPSEFVYLHATEQRGDLTVRRNHPSEVFARFVAGGTLLLDRGLLASLGDFRRVRKFVDAQLLAGVEAAGGRIYRTHGLGYILRRTGAGHTWQRDDEEFRRPDIVASEWSGFRPSRALEIDPVDRPDGGE